MTRRKYERLTTVAGLVYHGRRILREIEPVYYGGTGSKRQRQRRVTTLCETCGVVADVMLHAVKRSGCVSCYNRQESVAIDPDALNSDVGRLLLEAAERSPELWRSERPEDREIVMEAVRELIGVVADYRGRAGMSHEEIGALVGLTRQRVHQIEGTTLKRARLAFGAAGREYAEHLDERGSDWTWWAA